MVQQSSSQIIKRKLLCKFRGILVLLTSDDVDEVISEHKGNTLSLHAKFALEISQKVAKINVNKLKRRTTEYLIRQMVKY